MSDPVEHPPSWVRSVFYLLIVIVIVACVVTFILGASHILSDPSSQSIRYSIVTFGAGLSLICGILWIGGVTGTISISPATQKAMWVTLIAAVLSITVTVYKDFFGRAETYDISGVVKKMDGKDPRDIVISIGFPPTYPIPKLEKNVELRVWKEPSGRLPTLAFTHPAYVTEDIDLNDRNKVELMNDKLHIIKPIELKPDPGSGG